MLRKDLGKLAPDDLPSVIGKFGGHKARQEDNYCEQGLILPMETCGRVEAETIGFIKDKESCF